MSVLVPISLGELYDKQSILFIKLERIKDREKLKNIQKEYDFLTKLCEEHKIENYYWHELVHINKRIWNIEDNIRKKESKKQYDNEFIQLARNVYYSNDERSRIKKEINTKYSSDLIEEKSYEKYE